jgi:hypothetical protein
MRKWFMAVSAVCLSASLAAAQSFEYQNKDGTIGTMRISVDEASGAVLISNPGDLIACDRDWATLSDRRSDKKASTAFESVRVGNVIKVKGTLKGEPVERELKIDSSPWFGDFATQLKYLEIKGLKKQEFWIVNPNEFKAVKMVATLKGEESFTTPAGTFKAHRYVVSLAGLPAALWNVSVWLRASDGVNLSYNRESLLASIGQ